MRDAMSSWTLITDNFPPGGGGVARYYGELVKASHWEATVISPWTTPELLSPGVGLGSRVRQARSAATISRDVANPLFFGQVHLALGAIRRGQPFGLFLHGGEWSGYGKWAPRAVDRVAARAAVVFANSSATMTDWLPIAKARGNVRVLRPGVPEEWLSAGLLAHASRRISGAGRTFLVVARLVRHKRIVEVIRAFAASDIARTAGARLIVVGQGPEGASVEQLCHDVAGASFEGRVSDDRLLQLYGQADYFVHCPSVDEGVEGYEGFGIVYLEAAAYGLPVLGTDSGGTLEAMAPDASFTARTDDWTQVARHFSEMATLPATAYGQLAENAIGWAARNAWMLRAREFEAAVRETEWS